MVKPSIPPVRRSNPTSVCSPVRLTATAAGRSIYQMSIMDVPKFLAVFDQPSPKVPTGRRDKTNSPAQALALLNDPFVAGQAEFWAKSLIEQPHRNPQQRLTGHVPSCLRQRSKCSRTGALD